MYISVNEVRNSRLAQFAYVLKNFAFISAASVLIAYIVLIFSGKEEGVIVLLPFAYLISYVILNSSRRNNSIIVTRVLLDIFLWIRLVLLPLLDLQEHSYHSLFANGNPDTMFTSICLCVYECIAISVAYAFLSRILVSSNTEIYTDKELMGAKKIYLVYILFALIVFLLIGRHLHLYDFVFKSIGNEIRKDETTDSMTLLIRQIISGGILFAFFYLTSELNNKHRIGTTSKYLNINILLALLMVCLIVGERRTSQVYIAFASCWLLGNVYVVERKKIYTYIGLCAIVVLVLMTIYKHFYAFLYDSYYEAIIHSQNSNVISVTAIDSYFYGIATIAKNINYASFSNLGVDGFAYDIMRNTFGLNFITPRSMLTTSEAYNSFLYNGIQTHGYLLSSVGYSYIYFGFILSPILTIVNLCVATFLERKMRFSKSMEMTYIWAYLYMRVCFGILGSFPPLLNLCSRYLILNGSIYFIAKYFNRKAS